MPTGLLWAADQEVDQLIQKFKLPNKISPRSNLSSLINIFENGANKNKDSYYAYVAFGII